MIKIIKIIIVITVIIGWMGMAGQAEAVIKRAGNIEVITDEPLFADSIVWYPGLTVEKSFQVKNRGRGAKTAQIETENESENRQLARILTVQIKEGTRGIFGIGDTKSLNNFFESSAISLGEVFPDDSGKVFSVAISMPSSAGNEYQDGRAKFDLRIGFLGESLSTVTVAGGSSGVLGKSGEEGRSGGSGETAGKEGSPASAEATAGEEGLEGESGEGEVAGAGTEGINWRFLAIIGGILGFGGLAGWTWLRLKRKRVY